MHVARTESKVWEGEGAKAETYLRVKDYFWLGRKNFTDVSGKTPISPPPSPPIMAPLINIRDPRPGHLDAWHRVQVLERVQTSLEKKPFIGQRHHHLYLSREHVPVKNRLLPTCLGLVSFKHVNSSYARDHNIRVPYI